MKKFILVSVILFIVSIGCKKMSTDGGACGCSPIVDPTLKLVIKSSTGADLLSAQTSGAYTKDNIQLYSKDATGKTTPLNFYIREPFGYGNEKFSYYTLNSTAIRTLRTGANSSATIYLKLGNDKLHELKLQFVETKPDPDQLIIDNKEAEKATGNILSYATIYYLTE